MFQGRDQGMVGAELEIVIPIFVNDQNIGQIDIDSHAVSPFTPEDEQLLEYVCDKVATIL